MRDSREPCSNLLLMSTLVHGPRRTNNHTGPPLTQHPALVDVHRISDDSSAGAYPGPSRSIHAAMAPTINLASLARWLRTAFVPIDPAHDARYPYSSRMLNAQMPLRACAQSTSYTACDNTTRIAHTGHNPYRLRSARLGRRPREPLHSVSLGEQRQRNCLMTCVAA